MIRFVSLGSSSAGNSVFFDVDGTEILVDAGLSFKSINNKLESIGRLAMNVDAVFVTHQHGDHCKAVPFLKKNFPDVKIYPDLFNNVEHGSQIVVGSALITPFRLSHDEPCHGFILEDQARNKVALITDTGTIPCESLGFLMGCNAIILEMNHDVEMLTDSNYTVDMQERIFCDHGHLRNEQGRELLELVAWPGLEAVMCYHLSESNNSPALAMYEAYAGVQKESPGCQVTCADKSKITDFITLM